MMYYSRKHKIMNTITVAIIISTVAELINGISVLLYFLAVNKHKQSINSVDAKDVVDARDHFLFCFHILQIMGIILSVLILFFLVAATQGQDSQNIQRLWLVTICLGISGTLIGVVSSFAFVLIALGKSNNIFFKNWFVRKFF